MADLIRHKRSSDPSAVPTAGDLELGELAVNVADGRLFLKKVNGDVVDVTSIAGIIGLAEALAGKVGTDDSRLTDSREWSADTAPQAEAEGGTATIRRAWTSERVRQAIVAWWNSVSSAFGRGFVAAPNEVAGRTALGLGTAAVGTLTEFATDDTVGKVLKVGDFGIGSNAVTPTGADLNTLVRTGFYIIPSPVNGPAGTTTNLLVLGNTSGSGRTMQIAQPVNGEAYYVRSQTAGVWSTWKQLYHSGNLLNIGTTAATARTALGLGSVDNTSDATKSIGGNAATATKLATGRTIGMTGDVTWTSPAFDGSGNVTAAATLANTGVTAGTYGKVTVNAKGLVTAGAALAAADIPALDAGKITSGTFAAARIPTLNQNTTGSAATLTTARTLTIGSTGKTFNGSANVAWSLAEIGAVTSDVDTTPGRLLTTDYLDIGKLDKTLWPKATSLLTLKNGPDRTVWVETGTVDAPHSGFYGKVTCQRRSSTTVIMEAKSLFEAARYTYTFTPLGDSGWVKETMHEVGEWVDLRPYLLSPYFWKSARDGSNHFPQIRLVDRNTVELRGIASYNASSAAPPNGVAFRVPEGFRPQMTSAGICFADSSSPLWFGQTAYLIQGQVNYSSDPGWANGNVRLLLLSAPNPVADGAVDLSGIRYYLN